MAKLYNHIVENEELVLLSSWAYVLFKRMNKCSFAVMSGSSLSHEIPSSRGEGTGARGTSSCG